MKAGRAKETERSYRHTYDKLREYKPRLDFNRIDLDMYYDFREWMAGNGLSLGSQGKHIKILKTVLNEAFDQGFYTSLAHKSRKFKVTTGEVFHLALTEKELEEIEGLDLGQRPQLGPDQIFVLNWCLDRASIFRF